MTAAALAPFHITNPTEYIIYAGTLAFIVGIIQFTLGSLKLGWIIDFLSHPVILGFTNAAALIIATSQLPKIL